MATNLYDTDTRRVESAPVLCCVTEDNGLELDISVTCTIMLVYDATEQANLAKSANLKPEDINRFFENNCQREVDSALLKAIAQIAQEHVSYQTLQTSESKIAELLSNALRDSWLDLYGIKICSITVSNIRANADDEKKIAAFAAASRSSSGVSTKARYFEGTILDSIYSQPRPWTCRCGTVSDGKFCPECGKPRS